MKKIPFTIKDEAKSEALKKNNGAERINNAIKKLIDITIDNINHSPIVKGKYNSWIVMPRRGLLDDDNDDYDTGDDVFYNCYYDDKTNKILLTFWTKVDGKKIKINMWYKM